MMTSNVVETVYGKYSKFEVVKKSGAFSTSFYVRKDGEVISGSFGSLQNAVEWAKKKGGVS